MATCTPHSEHMTTRMTRPHPYPHPGPGPNPNPGPSATRSGPRSGRCTRRLWTRPRKRPREGACGGVIGAWRGEREGGEADSVATQRELVHGTASRKPHPTNACVVGRRARRTREGRAILPTSTLPLDSRLCVDHMIRYSNGSHSRYHTHRHTSSSTHAACSNLARRGVAA